MWRLGRKLKWGVISSVGMPTLVVRWIAAPIHLVQATLGIPVGLVLTLEKFWSLSSEKTAEVLICQVARGRHDFQLYAR